MSDSCFAGLAHVSSSGVTPRCSGGRAWRFSLHPLTYCEIPDFDLLQALNRGLIPQHYDTNRYRCALAGYVDDYLKEEVFDEGLVRNTPACLPVLRRAVLQPRQTPQFQQHR